jgi:hypothetical protein
VQLINRNLATVPSNQNLFPALVSNLEEDFPLISRGFGHGVGFCGFTTTFVCSRYHAGPPGTEPFPQERAPASCLFVGGMGSGRGPAVLRTLRDAGEYIQALPRAKLKPEWEIAAETLLAAVEGSGPLMFAEIAMRKAVNAGKPAPEPTPRRRPKK